MAAEQRRRRREDKHARRRCAYIDRHGLEQVSDAAEIEGIVARVLAANPDKVAAAKMKPAMLGWFVGQVMQATGGKANPRAVNALLKDKLGI